MLRSFLIIKGSGGLVLYRKAFLSGAMAQPRMVGGLISALSGFSLKHAGLPFSYIEMEKMAVTVSDVEVRIRGQSERLLCALFHDIEDGETFARLQAAEILRSFVDEYGERLVNLRLTAMKAVEDAFNSFSAQLFKTFERSVQSILLNLQFLTHARHVVFLRPSDSACADLVRSVWHSSGSNDSNDAKIVADLQGLLNLASDLLGRDGDNPSVITVGDRIRIERMPRATLIVAYNTSSGYIDALQHVDEALKLIGRVIAVLDHLQGSDSP